MNNINHPAHYGGQDNFEQLLDKELAEIKKVLLEKNRKYGNAALEPKKIFSQVEARERLNIRLDEKISRLLSMQDDEDEDILFDITGIYILRRILDSTLGTKKK